MQSEWTPRKGDLVQLPSYYDDAWAVVRGSLTGAQYADRVRQVDEFTRHPGPPCLCVADRHESFPVEDCKLILSAVDTLAEAWEALDSIGCKRDIYPQGDIRNVGNITKRLKFYHGEFHLSPPGKNGIGLWIRLASEMVSAADQPKIEALFQKASALRKYIAAVRAKEDSNAK